jgi:hypothetical protein
MVHLVRRTDHGVELRSRYWTGHRMLLNLPGPLPSIPLDGALSALGLKRRLIGLRVAYEQLLHDQTEMTNLSSFLADLYREFGRDGDAVPGG